jgi:ABC-2 type transport system permease protein
MEARFWMIVAGAAWTPVAIAIALRLLQKGAPRDLSRLHGARALVGAALGVALLALLLWVTNGLPAPSRFGVSLAAHAALAAFLLAYARSVDPASPLVRFDGIASAVARGALVYAAFIPVILAAHVLNAWCVGSEAETVQRTIHDLLAERGPGQAALILNVVLAVPLFEEITFRGLLQQGVRAQIALVAPPERASMAAVFLTSLAFTALHDPVTYIPVFVLSLILGGAFERAGSIVVPIAMHAAHNLAVVLTETVAHPWGSAS